MNNKLFDPRNKEDNTRSSFEVEADVTPRREGGDDALGERVADDSRADEKVIVNEQSERQIVNATSTNDSDTIE